MLPPHWRPAVSVHVLLREEAAKLVADVGCLSVGKVQLRIVADGGPLVAMLGKSFDEILVFVFGPEFADSLIDAGVSGGGEV